MAVASNVMTSKASASVSSDCSLSNASIEALPNMISKIGFIR